MWTHEDRLIALVWQQEKDARCGGCGHPVTESMAAENRNAYEVEAYTCHACLARQLAEKDAAESQTETAGVYFAAVRRQEV